MIFDLTRLPPVDQYKLLSATIVPRPIAWVVSQNLEGQVNAAPFSFFNVFSAGPPIICIGMSAKEPGHPKDTTANIRATGEFVVNLVGHANAEAMNVTAIDFGTGINELTEAGLTTAASVKIKPPRIVQSPVALECVRHSILELGADRALLIGEVVVMHVRDDAVLDGQRCHIDTMKLDLIGRMHGGGWYIRTMELFDMPRLAAAEREERQ